ncbi:MAG: GTP-binding protein [Lachnospiraceae bacterium]|jgi:G3E family GTPase|nr:GTP-binding protein [Lachnospiraceae bacterium]
MTKIDIISGFLGAGKTTLIKKLIAEAFQGEKLVLIENEFGEIGIDGGFLKDAGIQITEMNSGCICCSLVGDFGTALKEVLTKFRPDRILIEPSGVGKLSDVIRAVQGVQAQVPVELNSFVAVVDAGKCKLYMKNFGEFFNNQVESANAIILSRTQNVSQDKLETAVSMLREHNEKAAIITTPWDSLTGTQLKDAMEKGHGLADEMAKELLEEQHKHDHHNHHEHGEECSCDCHDHHEHQEECSCHDHHDHDHQHQEECSCHGHDHHDHEHHHDHAEECSCGCHDHDHHHHHADEVFTSWGVETAHKYERSELEAILEDLADTTFYGTVLRAKGMLPTPDGAWLYFDLTPGEYEIREGSPEYTGRLCVIGSDLKEEDLKKAFHIA